MTQVGWLDRLRNVVPLELVATFDDTSGSDHGLLLSLVNSLFNNRFSLVLGNLFS